jgi:hypothetical protein
MSENKIAPPPKVSFFNGNQDIFDEVYHLGTKFDLLVNYTRSLAESNKAAFEHLNGQIVQVQRAADQTAHIKNLENQIVDLNKKVRDATDFVETIRKTNAIPTLENLLNLFLTGDKEEVAKRLANLGELSKVLEEPSAEAIFIEDDLDIGGVLNAN